MNAKKFFIAIGPPKTGTTWLYANLQNHPEVVLPTVKEIRYFWENDKLGKGSWLRNITSKHWHHREKRSILKARLREHFSGFLKGSLNTDKIKWDMHWFFGRHDDQWYRELFDAEKLSGDISPKYSELSSETVKSILQIVPEAKVIISLRDPVERTWSRAKMNLMKRKQVQNSDQVSDASFHEHFVRTEAHNSNDYVSLVERWKTVFGDQVKVIFYDEIQENPQAVLDEVCTFLGIGKHLFPSANERANEGIKEVIPDKHRKVLVELNTEFLRKMKNYFISPYPSRWHDEYVGRAPEDDQGKEDTEA